MVTKAHERSKGRVVTVKEAAELLGVSRSKIWRLVKEGILPVETNPLDKRERLIPVVALERLERKGRHPMPRTVASASIPDLQSDELEKFLDDTWRPA